MSYRVMFKKFWEFLKADTWQSWIVSLLLAFVFIKFIFFPLMSLVFVTPLPLVVVESCSMYHTTNFDAWYESNEIWYKNKGITKEVFEEFPFKNGLNKGDIILVSGRGEHDLGDVIVFETGTARFPLIHRIVEENPIGTKGDKNFEQLQAEIEIDVEDILGKGLVRVPGLGWVKLIFFEWARSPDERGFCG